jgi:hypothetical protein
MPKIFKHKGDVEGAYGPYGQEKPVIGGVCDWNMSYFVVDVIKKRVFRENKNYLGVICGETGSGKSYCAMKIGEMVDPNFSIERVAFTPEGFMKILNSRLKKGSVVVFDEAGVGMPAREWRSIANKALGYIFQTFRHLNLAVLFTTPSFDFVDIQARKLFHSYMQTIRIDYSNEIVVMKYMNLQLNPRYGKIYIKYPRISGRFGKTVTMNRIFIGKPSKDLCRRYELKKIRYSERLRLDIEKSLGGIGGISKIPGKMKQDLIADRLNKGMKVKDIAKEVGTSVNYVRVVKSNLT